MKKWMVWTSLSLAAMLAGCNDDGLDAITTVDSNFETGTDNWVAEFAEYDTTTVDSTLTMKFAQTRLPTGLDTSQHAFRIQSTNRSDDMFMYLKKKVTGFVPNATYLVQFDINLATNYPANSIGVGGSPGSSVYFKVGASGAEPARKLQKTFYQFTLDKGQQSQGGVDAIVLGDVANGREDSKYALIKKTNSDKPFTIKANANGEIWLFVGTDSGYEGLTVLYYDRIKVTITEQQIN
ncbi:MAG: hypothetical protein ABIN80_16045 [Dyadobacter sp.]|uniref:hypothetical protein n=1 Tax=Dyadobacter sp. TaxID=1914288 RepID=UPI003264A14A